MNNIQMISILTNNIDDKILIQNVCRVKFDLKC